MNALNQAKQTMSSEDINSLIKRVMPMARGVDVVNDPSPEDVGAMNSVAAAGGEFSKTTIQLFVLQSRGDITGEEYDRLVLHFIESESE